MIEDCDLIQENTTCFDKWEIIDGSARLVN